jgi:hypothetical protein
MAKVGNNILTQGLQGKVGNIIFRKRGKKTTVYMMSPRKAPFSNRQKEAQLKFAEAVKLAREALRNETERKKFSKLAISNGKESAYSAAISYFLLRK